MKDMMNSNTVSYGTRLMSYLNGLIADYGYLNPVVLEEFYDESLHEIAEHRDTPEGKYIFNKRKIELDTIVNNKLAELLAVDTDADPKALLSQIRRVRKNYTEMSLSEIHGLIVDSYFS